MAGGHRPASPPDGAADPETLLHGQLRDLLRERFGAVEEVTEHGMRGFRVRRPVTIEAWRGTLDPNWFRVYVAARSHGLSVHLWNPYDPSAIQHHAPELARHGLKAMVGCIQHTRKGPFPVEAIVTLLDEVAGRMAAEQP